MSIQGKGLLSHGIGQLGYLNQFVPLDYPSLLEAIFHPSCCLPAIFATEQGQIPTCITEPLAWQPTQGVIMPQHTPS